MTDRPAPSTLGLYARSVISVLIVIAAWEAAARLQLVSALFLPWVGSTEVSTSLPATAIARFFGRV